MYLTTGAEFSGKCACTVMHVQSTVSYEGACIAMHGPIWAMGPWGAYTTGCTCMMSLSSDCRARGEGTGQEHNSCPAIA